MKIKGEYSYSVQQRDVDFSDAIRYSALVDFILQAAGDDADAKGFGVKDLNCGNASWVLTRVAVESYRRLTLGEEFTVTTWVNNVNRLTTTRNMILTDRGGERLAAAVTQWAVIELDKRVSLDIREHADCRHFVVDEPSPIEPPARITRVEPTLVAPHKVVYSDLDFNRHVTSVRYLDWMFDLFPIEYHTSRELARLDINFLHEARYGQNVEIGLQETGDSLFCISDDAQTNLCKARIIWR